MLPKRLKILSKILSKIIFNENFQDDFITLENKKRKSSLTVHR